VIQPTISGLDATRLAITSQAGREANAELIGVLFDFASAMRRATSAGSATTPILARLAAAGPMRACDLADMMHLDTSTVSRHVSALESQGLVRRAQMAEDRRAHALELTEAGQVAAAEQAADRVARFEAVTSGWSDDDIRTLSRLLTALMDGMNDPEGSEA
jgi:DNA-binding MarR family transcriptional regulator